MVKKMFVSSCIAVLLAGSALSCSDAAGPGNTAVAEVFIFGLDRTVSVGQTLQFEGRAATGSGVRVDEMVTWSVSSASVLSVTGELLTVSGNIVNRATVTGAGAGGADLIATAGGKTHSVRITVSAPVP